MKRGQDGGEGDKLGGLGGIGGRVGHAFLLASFSEGRRLGLFFLGVA